MAASADSSGRGGHPFDAARVDVWLSEAVGEPEARDRAGRKFAGLSAQPYLERVRSPSSRPG